MQRYRHRILLSQEEISLALDGLVRRLRPQLAQDEITAIPVLGGAMIFAADLLRRLPSGLLLDFMRIQSYGNSTVPQQAPHPDWTPHPENVEGRHILLLDDILDTGRTLAEARRYLLEEMGAAKVTLAVLIDKPVRRAVAIEADAYALRFEEDLFLVGYGLDYRGRYRNLPHLVALELNQEGEPSLQSLEREVC